MTSPNRFDISADLIPDSLKGDESEEFTLAQGITRISGISTTCIDFIQPVLNQRQAQTPADVVNALHEIQNSLSK